VPEGFAEDVLAHEVREAAKRLGISDERLYVMDYPVRWLPKYRQEILEELVRLRKKVNPDLVLVHASADVHQDHHTLYEEAVRAFKRVTILGYLVPWNVIEGDSRLVIGLREEYFNNKIAALDAYKSQQRRAYADPEFIRAWARTCGIAIETPYAETYEVIRWVIQP
jgi:LmbE family N-acetylglucosaminyl deacetylase